MVDKKFIKVVAKHLEDGSVRPLKIEYENVWYEIDRLLDVRMAASLKMGGQGLRYTCRMCGKAVYLFCDEGQWFLEN